VKDVTRAALGLAAVAIAAGVKAQDLAPDALLLARVRNHMREDCSAFQT
jgi:hypothetical protein